MSHISSQSQASSAAKNYPATNAGFTAQDRIGHLDAIIKAYDVRGVVPDQWDTATASAMGAAVADVLCRDQQRIVVGYDMRPTSPALVEAFAQGAQLRGVDVTSMGLTSTDGLYFASGHLDCPGAMFTASHNPAQYNGIKLCHAGAKAVGQDTGLGAIRELTEKYLAESDITAVEAPGSFTTTDLIGAYAAYLRQLVDLSRNRPLRIIVDAGNGMGGLTVPAVLETAAGLDELPLTITPMYFELDGSFPNHEANPLDPKNLEDLQRAMRDNDADLGLAFDGDADRCFAVDENGDPISPSSVTALVAAREIAKEIAAGNNDPVVLHNVITSNVVARTIEQAGGTAVRTRVGHSHIKAEMAATGAVFGGEHSAHYYFREFWGADTGILAAMHLLAALGESDGTASDLMRQYATDVTSGEINSTVTDQAAASDRAVSALSDLGEVEVDTLDGVTVAAVDHSWWANIRPSNTEPLLRLNVEGATEELMVAARDAALSAIRS